MWVLLNKITPNNQIKFAELLLHCRIENISTKLAIPLPCHSILNTAAIISNIYQTTVILLACFSIPNDAKQIMMSFMTCILHHIFLG
jgi:hypothetical protein